MTIQLSFTDSVVYPVHPLSEIVWKGWQPAPPLWWTAILGHWMEKDSPKTFKHLPFICLLYWLWRTPRFPLQLKRTFCGCEAHWIALWVARVGLSLCKVRIAQHGVVDQSVVGPEVGSWELQNQVAGWGGWGGWDDNVRWLHACTRNC